MKLLGLLTSACALAICAPALAADTYRGDVRGGGKLEFQASNNRVTKFIAVNIPFECNPASSRGKGAGGFKAAQISGSDRIKENDSGTIRERGLVVRYDDVLRGNFSKDRRSVEGMMRFQNHGEADGERFRCETERLRWSAKLR